MIRLSQFAASPFCDKVRRVLRYKGLEFEIYEWPIAEAASIREKNPAGKLPIVDVDGETIADSTTIALELERRYPDPPLLPSDAVARAQVLLLEDWADESLYFYEMATRFGAEDFERNLWKLLPGVPKEMHGSVAPMVREALRGACAAQGTGRKSAADLEADVERLFGAIEDLQRATGFVVGSGLTLADVAIAAQAECIGDSTIGRKVLANRPALARYFERIDRLTSADRV